jgi:streptomycin 6-kinase
VTAAGVEIPADFLGNAARGPDWASWLQRLPRLVRDVLAEWSLTPDGTPNTGHGALVLPVLTGEGEAAALKFGWPHPEAEHEHLALRAWAGDGTVRLLRADPRRWVLLLERAEAGVDLDSLPVLEACEVIAGFYPRIHRPALPQLRLLSDQAARWSRGIPALREHRAVPRRYVEQAASLARDFASDPATDGTLIHTDLHFQNVLSAEREPWLVIDPKPLSGEPAYELAPLLWNRWDEVLASGNPRWELLERFRTVVDAAGWDEERARAWVIVREVVNVMWALEDGSDAGVDDDWVTRAVTIVKAVQP